MNNTYYKALLKGTMKSMTNDMEYELNKEYELDNDGFHYTPYISILPRWYITELCEIYVVEPLGHVSNTIYEYDLCTNKIKILRKLSDEEIKEIIDKELDILVNDKDWRVHRVVAKHGRDKDLDILVNDKDWLVRRAVAKHNRDKDLDILVNDKDWRVRRVVAEHGRDKDLDILVTDNDSDVRREVMKHERYKELVPMYDTFEDFVEWIDCVMDYQREKLNK